VLSGSEDGKPYLWDNVAITQATNQFQYSLVGPISDVAWNDTYHMIALSGFGDEHPIIVYTWER
jgi:jouberin